ncbi:MAG: error-prone DNA polymerase [Pelomonas sp.]|nr:error-prone DNA polymerase [Roseateles sp.]
MSNIPAYAELHCLSNFSFLRGASNPDELVERAEALGYTALALTDECSLAGVVRAHVQLRRMRAAAEAEGRDPPRLQFIVGSEFLVHAAGAGTDGAALFKLVLLPVNLTGYGNLSQFITRLRRDSPKGTYMLRWPELRAAALDDCLVLFVPQPAQTDAALLEQARWLLAHFSGRAWIAVELLREAGDAQWLARLQQLGEATALPLVAAGDVHMHRRARKPLQDVMTATRLGRPVMDCGFALQPNAERHLRSRLRLAQVYPPELLAETLRVAAACEFSLDELRYRYPSEVVPAGVAPMAHLRALTWAGAALRWPAGVPPQWRARIEHELALIEELRYEHYFLTVADVVAYARELKILCQGRGSAANSIVCYCLHVTSVDPDRSTLLFERFISRERGEPPDIDVDFEHERREEVIQYLYAKYGRERAALTAVVISYRPRSALRDVGRALGFDEAELAPLARRYSLWSESLAPAALDAPPRVALLFELAGQLLGMPRHLSQHVGGFVLTEGPLTRLVPVENATMPGRSVIQWDKDDIDALNLMKVDVLALGMLSCLRRSFELVRAWRGREWTLATIPEGDAPTYAMICAADTVGIFQIESRAQMSMLPRLRPRHYYDLVVEVAIVRPGPIEGGMVHPYLQNRARARRGETIDVPPGLEAALARTFGVPIFQEQVMQVAMIAAGFSAGEADQLRRAMAAWKRPGDLERFHDKIIANMRARGYSDEFAAAIFRQIKGFASYGFPESHAASFALLTYVSSWLKCHEPAIFLCALLNSQPLGFYTPSQLVQDARRHGVEVRPADVATSGLDSTLEPRSDAAPAGAPTDSAAAAHAADPAVRLGLRLVAGLPAAAAERIVAARAAAPFADARDLAQRAALNQREMQQLAAADALASLAGHRRQQIWQAAAQQPLPLLLREAAPAEEALALPAAPEGEEVLWDYAATGLTLRRHPLALLRERLAQRGYRTAAQLGAVPGGRSASACGLITGRQRPQTAKGTLFVTLEDETGPVQVIVWPTIFGAHRDTILAARLLGVRGEWQRGDGDVRHLVARRFEDLTPLLGRLRIGSRDFR